MLSPAWPVRYFSFLQENFRTAYNKYLILCSFPMTFQSSSVPLFYNTPLCKRFMQSRQHGCQWLINWERLWTDKIFFIERLMHNNLSTDKRTAKQIEKDILWTKRRQQQWNYMSFAWNLKQKAVQDKNASPCDYSKWHDGNSTHKLHLSGTLEEKCNCRVPNNFKRMTKKKLYLASQTVLLFSLWAETVEST